MISGAVCYVKANHNNHSIWRQWICNVIVIIKSIFCLSTYKWCLCKSQMCASHCECRIFLIDQRVKRNECVEFVYFHCKYTHEEQEIAAGPAVTHHNLISSWVTFTASSWTRPTPASVFFSVRIKLIKLQVWKRLKIVQPKIHNEVVFKFDEFGALTVVFTLLVSLWRCSRRQTLALTPCSQWHREEWTCSKWVWPPSSSQHFKLWGEIHGI